MHFKHICPLLTFFGLSLASPLLDIDIATQRLALEKRVGAPGGLTTQGNLTAGLPGGCNFQVGSALNYVYWDLSSKTPDGGSCCVGAIVGGLTRQGCQAWNRENARDLLSTVSGQLAKDGQFESTKVGRWRGSFPWLTTAFDDRTLDYFDGVFTPNNCEGCDPYSMGTGSATWLYSRHYNYMQLDFLGSQGNCDDNQADPAPPGGSTWNDPYGPVAVGSFSWFILPRWTMDGQLSSTATFTIFTQDGDSQNSIKHGPLNVDCISETDWQGLPGSATGLPYDIVFQAGHICATGLANNNYDGLHVKYANIYVDVPERINDHSCVKHDSGVSCNYPVRPA